MKTDQILTVLGEIGLRLDEKTGGEKLDASQIKIMDIKLFCEALSLAENFLKVRLFE